MQKRLGELNQKYKKGHPLYSMSLEEELEAINNVSVADMKAYYNDFYGISNNTSLIAIGNIYGQKLKSYFVDNYAEFKSSLPYAEIKDAYAKNNAVNENIKTPDKQNAFTLGLLNFECSQYDKDYAALQVAGSVFDGGFLSSRIATRLRQQDGVSYGAGGGVNVDSNKDDKNSAIYIYAIYAPENDTKGQNGFKEEIARFIKDGITQQELDDAVKGWVQA